MLTATGNRLTFEIARQSRLAHDIAATQVQISTGNRLQAGSDDPEASARIAQIDMAQANQVSWASNIALGTTLSAQADEAMSSLSDALLQARELLVAGTSGTASPADRVTVASRLRSLADQVNDLAGTRTSLDRPLFATGGATALRVSDSQLVTPVPNAASVFEVGGIAITRLLSDAATALERNDVAASSASLTALMDAIDHVANARAEQGNQAARLDSLADRNAILSTDLAAERSTLADTDIGSAVAILNGKTLTLEAAQAAFARLNRRTLFDILG